jgi:hypothetical protein
MCEKMILALVAKWHSSSAQWAVGTGGGIGVGTAAVNATAAIFGGALIAVPTGHASGVKTIMGAARGVRGRRGRKTAASADCEKMKRRYGVVIGATWGTLPTDKRMTWQDMGCDKLDPQVCGGGAQSRYTVL